MTRNRVPVQGRRRRMGPESRSWISLAVPAARVPTRSASVPPATTAPRKIGASDASDLEPSRSSPRRAGLGRLDEPLGHRSAPLRPGPGHPNLIPVRSSRAGRPGFTGSRRRERNPRNPGRSPSLGVPIRTLGRVRLHPFARTRDDSGLLDVRSSNPAANNADRTRHDPVRRPGHASLAVLGIGRLSVPPARPGRHAPRFASQSIDRETPAP